MDDRVTGRIDYRTGEPRKRVPRLPLYLGGFAVLALLAWVSPGALPVVGAAIHWVIALTWIVMGVVAWNWRVRIWGMPARVVLVGLGLALLAVAALRTFTAVG
jgi:hypothetical protein